MNKIFNNALFFYKKNLIWNILLGILAIISIIGMSVIDAFVLNSIFTKDFTKVLIFLGVTAFIYLAKMFLAGIYRVHKNKYKEKVANKFLNELVYQISKKEINEVSDSDVYLSWFTNDIEFLKDNYIESIFSILESSLYIIFSVSILAYLNIYILLFFIVSVIVIFIVSSVVGQRIEAGNLRISKYNEEYLEKVNNILGGIKIFYFLNRENIFLDRLNIHFENMKKEKIKFIKEYSFFSLILETLSLVAQISILLLSGYFVVKGELSIGSIAIIGQLIGVLSNSIYSLSRDKTMLSASKTLIEKFDVLLDDKLNKKEIKNIEKIEYKDINVIYEDKKVLNNFNLTIEKGKKYLIIGESGSGKSIIVNLLLGLNSNYTGDILINDIDVKEVSKDSIFNNISYVNSDNYIFKSNILENISLYEDKDVSGLIKEFRLEEIDREQELSDSNISTGQKQRINLARAILFNRGYIILDEATANLDIENRRYIEDRLLLDKEKTIIMITHHLDDELKNKFDEHIILGGNSNE